MKRPERRVQGRAGLRGLPDADNAVTILDRQLPLFRLRELREVVALCESLVDAEIVITLRESRIEGVIGNEFY